MKYAIASTLALILCMAAGIGLMQWISAEGDGEAAITPYEQQSRRIQAIEKFIAP